MKIKNKKWKIALYAFAVIAFAAVISVVSVLAARQTVANAGVSVSYVPYKVVGTVKAEYQVGAGEWTTIGTEIEWDGTETTVDTQSVSMSAFKWHGNPEEVKFRFTFTNKDTGADGYIDKWQVSLDSTGVNLGTNFEVASSTYSESFNVISTANGGSAVVHTMVYRIKNGDLDASITGTFKWNIDAVLDRAV